MKHLLFYIVFAACFFKPLPDVAADTGIPADFTGTATIKMLQKRVNNDTDAIPENATMEQIAGIYLEIGKYFYDHYSDDELHDDDFIDKLRPFFPDDSDAELRDKQIILNNVIAIYHEGREFYDKTISQVLVPEDIPYINDASEYDNPDEVPYVEADKDHFIKVYNFKKFISYGHNKTELRAIENFISRSSDPEGLAGKLAEIRNNVKFKDLLLYGYTVKNPLLSEQGVSPWIEEGNVRVRLLARQPYLNDSPEIDVGLHINTAPYTFIPANNISPEILKPQFDFSLSENLDSAAVFYPLPMPSHELPQVHKYYGDFMIPLRLKPADPKQPLLVRAQIRLNSCDGKLDCSPLMFTTELKILPEGKSAFGNGYDNFFYHTFANLPHSHSKYLQLKKISVDNDEEHQVLRAEFESSEKIRSFRAYIEDKDGYILFGAPLISLYDNKIYARFIPLDNSVNLRNKKFTITATLNKYHHLRTETTAQSVSEFDTDSQRLNLGLIFLALLGGLLLNFMPCVFPVLALKISAFCSLKSNRKHLLQRQLLSTVGGIFAGFSLLIGLILIIKLLGGSIGWGMQYQSMSFLVVMTMVLSLFAVMAASNYNFRIPITPWNDFLLGNLIVLLSTPCTGPYLATAVGFAFSRSYTEIIVIMYSIALGLSLPYLSVLLLKNPLDWLPKPGKWMVKMQMLAFVLLLITIGWFLLLILQQTSWEFTLSFVLVLFLLAFIADLFIKFLDFLQLPHDERIPLAQITRIRRYAKIIAAVIFIIIAAVCSWRAEISYHRNLEIRRSRSAVALDQAQITQYLAAGHPVLVEISADWCLTCHANNLLVLNKLNINDWHKRFNLELIRIDWTDYNAEILDFMEKYGRKGLPFYILYTPFIREGLVLPEIFGADEIENILSAL